MVLNAKTQAKSKNNALRYREVGIKAEFKHYTYICHAISNIMPSI